MSYDPYFPDPPGPARQPRYAPQPPPGRGYGDPPPGREYGDPFGDPAAWPPAAPHPDPYTEPPGRTPYSGPSGHTPYTGPSGTAPDDELPRLRAGYRRLRRVATLTALGYFVLFLLLSAYAPDLMTGRINGGLTTGVLLGLLTLPVALVAITVYERIAHHRVDPLAAAIRAAHEGRPAATTGDPHGGPNLPGGSAWDRPTGGMRI
ncbi:DUF485 domain-containing protein [Streptomyces sp. PKU-MA01144]|uniref:DUF485 domain-containing protein n=1 Tax=Streptomyces TaxID=1883 RepID=UPI00147E246D|nr:MULTISPECIES: DUF485 domain-containing protein [Streptomyces]MCY0983289.1 DUF485 domain-containing protein [Streptomyces tirandamycinicus]NNJ03470.1 DUF485 domain-containing protein [Streptomyces sp. PKU-MA01144]